MPTFLFEYSQSAFWLQVPSHWEQYIFFYYTCYNIMARLWFFYCHYSSIYPIYLLCNRVGRISSDKILWTRWRQVSYFVILSSLSFIVFSHLEALRKLSAVWFLLSVYFSRWRTRNAYFSCARHSGCVKRPIIFEEIIGNVKGN